VPVELLQPLADIGLQQRRLVYIEHRQLKDHPPPGDLPRHMSELRMAAMQRIERPRQHGYIVRQFGAHLAVQFDQDGRQFPPQYLEHRIGRVLAADLHLLGRQERQRYRFCAAAGFRQRPDHQPADDIFLLAPFAAALFQHQRAGCDALLVAQGHMAAILATPGPVGDQRRRAGHADRRRALRGQDPRPPVGDGRHLHRRFPGHEVRRAHPQEALKGGMAVGQRDLQHRPRGSRHAHQPGQRLAPAAAHHQDGLQGRIVDVLDNLPDLLIHCPCRLIYRTPILPL